MQTDPPDAPDSENVKEWFSLVFRSLCLLAFIGYIGYSAFLDAHQRSLDTQKWNALQDKSTTHMKLVSSYRECSNKFISGTEAECLVLTKEYSEILRIDKTTSETILNEIVILSE